MNGQGVKDAYVWDLDGTLLNSYDVIVDGIIMSLSDLGLSVNRDEVLEKIKVRSMNAYLMELKESTGIDLAGVREKYTVYTHQMEDRICLVPGAYETLEGLQNKGVEHYVYTHRGSSTKRILQRLGIGKFFKDIVTSEAGFAPKPSPEGLLYLMEKHGLVPENTWYVGDRNLDVTCAKNAGAHGILFLEEGSYVEPDGTEDRIVHSLIELI